MGEFQDMVISPDYEVNEEGLYDARYDHYTDICYDQEVDIYADYPAPLPDATPPVQARAGLGSAADEPASTGASMAPSPATVQDGQAASARGDMPTPPSAPDDNTTANMSSGTPGQLAFLILSDDGTSTASAAASGEPFPVQMGVRASDEVIADDEDDSGIAPTPQLSDPPKSTGELMRTPGRWSCLICRCRMPVREHAYVLWLIWEGGISERANWC